MTFSFPPQTPSQTWPQLHLSTSQARARTTSTTSSSSAQTEPHSSSTSSTSPGDKASKRSHGYASDSSLPQLTCAICMRKYSRKDNLKTHQRVHTKEKPFQCTICPRTFRWVGNLRNHESVHRRRAARAVTSKPVSPGSTPTSTPHSRAGRKPGVNSRSPKTRACRVKEDLSLVRGPDVGQALSGFPMPVLDHPILDMIDEELVSEVPLPEFGENFSLSF